MILAEGSALGLWRSRAAGGMPSAQSESWEASEGAIGIARGAAEVPDELGRTYWLGTVIGGGGPTTGDLSPWHGTAIGGGGPT
jgi:hypothetical protein